MNIEVCPSEDAPIELLLEADPSEKHIRDYVKRGVVYVAEEEGIVGVFVLLPTRPGTIELVNIAVTEARRGEGIGKRLLEAAKEAAEGYKRIEVGTGNSSTNQLSLYQKAGFRITGIDHDFFTIHYEETIWENGIWCRDMIRLTLEL
ncbi:GNAT family N-acetyltransferase [Salimicrobium halophilum]|uniref:Acetyltransferase (GNAT) family protein n=1 Tax=Salimicrobium halophilum TaxID=86666 RepID=A0A1G8RIN3_9BACI|nr:GNAT family N-acetyltransferase [Salimicrobium halophilum]SDJ16733.1 Acetyltransferase (GNAT) family protein [Salimicrobium halophilum]